MTTVIVFGPPLPGRDLLQHALARALPAGVRLEVADLVTARERRDRAAALAATGERAIFVAREPLETVALHEIRHHYSGIATRLADLRWQAFLDDARQREPAGDEVTPMVVARDGEPVDAVVASVLALIGGVDAPAPPRPRRVLVVDDDPAQVALVGDALRELGCLVTTAPSAEDAMQRIGETEFDLVVSDERMPGAHGTDLAAAISALRPGLRVAIVTGFPEDAAAKLNRGPNVDLVLAKPLGIVDLVHLVEEMSVAR
ncbi:MAG: response regulator [Deltaproteobacteria bacterium]|nr:response regulator [Kofleriaceae bacterium]